MTNPPVVSCGACRHWRQLPDAFSARAAAVGPVGTCHAFPPSGNFAFPRTKETDHCGCWESSDAPAGDVPKLRAKYRPRAAEP